MGQCRAPGLDLGVELASSSEETEGELSVTAPGVGNNLYPGVANSNLVFLVRDELFVHE